MKTKQLINKLDALFFGYGNAIQGCLKSKRYRKASSKLDEFYSEYYKLVSAEKRGSLQSTK